MAHAETKVFTAHVPLPLAEKIDQFAARLDRFRQRPDLLARDFQRAPRHAVARTRRAQR